MGDSTRGTTGTLQAAQWVPSCDRQETIMSLRALVCSMSGLLAQLAPIHILESKQACGSHVCSPSCAQL